MNKSNQYIGSELNTFSRATNWKRYFSQLIRPYISGDILEVGAGVGGTTSYLWHRDTKKWVCLEPDATLCEEIEQKINQKQIPQHCQVQCGTIDDLPQKMSFDTIIYIDVLEHIEDDTSELLKAASRLNKGGHIIILSPAHQYLFSSFDKAVGHYRRYNKRMLTSAIPPELVVEKLHYADSMGLLLSLGNKVCLKKSNPTIKQVQLWDTLFVPISRVTDMITHYRIGKSIIATLKLRLPYE